MTTILGRFEVQQTFDRGDNGKIHRALDRQTNQLVAIREVRAHQHIPMKFARREWNLAQDMAHDGFSHYIDAQEEAVIFTL